jgi:hypothetical protein
MFVFDRQPSLESEYSLLYLKERDADATQTPHLKQQPATSQVSRIGIVLA